jgi:hypothetical protein
MGASGRYALKPTQRPRICRQDKLLEQLMAIKALDKEAEIIG